MFEINGMSRTPVYEQLIDQIEKYIASGILRPGDQLPSVRSLSFELSVNPNTIQKAFGELTLRGIICGVPGKGNFVTDEAPEVVRNKAKKRVPEYRKLVHELALSGVTKDELISIIDEEFFREGGAIHDKMSESDKEL